MGRRALPVAGAGRVARRGITSAAAPALRILISDVVIAATTSSSCCSTDVGRAAAATAASASTATTAVTSLATAWIGVAGVTTDDRQEDVRPDDTMTLTEHLGELRARIIRSALAVTIGMVLVVAFYDQVLDFLLEPYRDLCSSKPPDFCTSELFNFTPTEGLSTRLRVGMYGGIILALPVILWQVWRFIVPALNKKEKQYAIPFVLSSVVLFLAGGALAYLTIGQALDFLISWSGDDVNQVYSVNSYVALIGLMIFAFGLGFLLPVLVVFLQLVGVVTPRRLMQSWRLALVGIAVIAAVITPSGDPITMAMLGVPMMILYFVAVLVGWLVVRKRPKDE